jgi:hypothetical protein
MTIPVDALAAQPELAFEQARLVISRLRMIRVIAGLDSVDAMFADPIGNVQGQTLAGAGEKVMIWSASKRTPISFAGPPRDRG